MDRIQHATAVDEKFVDPDPGAGRRGTIALAEWFNGVQEELVGLITAAGLTPAAGVYDQLRKAVLRLVHPVNTVYLTYGNLTPEQLFGIGTWAEIGQGQVLVGRDTGQTEFDTIGKTGGAKTHTLTAAQLPAHRHALFSAAGTHRPPLTDANFAKTDGTDGSNDNEYSINGVSSPEPTHGLSSSVGSGQAHNNLQPYLVVRMWRRTA